MKTWRSDGIAPSILNLGTRWGWMVSFMPLPLYPWGKNTHDTTHEALICLRVECDYYSSIIGFWGVSYVVVLLSVTYLIVILLIT